MLRKMVWRISASPLVLAPFRTKKALAEMKFDKTGTVAVAMGSVHIWNGEFVFVRRIRFRCMRARFLADRSLNLLVSPCVISFVLWYYIRVHFRFLHGIPDLAACTLT